MLFSHNLWIRIAPVYAIMSVDVAIKKECAFGYYMDGTVSNHVLPFRFFVSYGSGLHEFSYWVYYLGIAEVLTRMPFIKISYSFLDHFIIAFKNPINKNLIKKQKQAQKCKSYLQLKLFSFVHEIGISQEPTIRQTFFYITRDHVN